MSRQRRVPTPPEESHRSAPAGNPGVIQTEETQTSPAEVTESPNPDRQVRGQVRVAAGRTPTSAPRTSRNYDDRRRNASPRYRKESIFSGKKESKSRMAFCIAICTWFSALFIFPSFTIRLYTALRKSALRWVAVTRCDG